LDVVIRTNVAFGVGWQEALAQRDRIKDRHAFE
jgi:hypothetical protein